MGFLIIAFLAAGISLILGAQDETLEEKRWVNHLADESRKGKKHGRKQRYTVAGCRMK